MDSDNDTPPPSARNTTLVTILAVGTLGSLLIFLTLITNGWILWMILGVSGIGALGVFHYMTWGRAMMQETEAEREKAQREADRERHW